MSEEIPAGDAEVPASTRSASPPPERVSSLLDGLMPALCDWCVLDLLDPQGALVRQAVRAADPAMSESAAALQGGSRLDLNAPRGPARAFRTGVAQICPELRPEELALEPTGLLRTLEAGPGLAVPLRSSEGVVGVLTLIRGRGRPPFGPAELHEVEERCRRWMGGEPVRERPAFQVEEILESTSDAFFALDQAWRFTHVNGNAERLLERTRAQLLGTSIWEQFPDMVGSTFDREYHRAMVEQVPVEFRELHRPPDTWVEVRGFPTRQGLSVFCRDVSGRVRAEREHQRLLRALEGERHLIQAVLDQLPMGVVVRDTAGCLMIHNERMQQILGRNLPVGLEELQLRRESGEPLAVEEFPGFRALRTGKPVPEQTIRVPWPNGEELITRVSAAPMRDAQGQVMALMAVVRDITDQREAEEALLQSVRRFRSLVEATTAVVWVTDPSGNLVEDSASWMAFTGQSREEHRGRGWLEAIHPDDRERVHRVWNEAVATRAPYEVECRLRRRDGSYAYTLSRAAPVLAGNGTAREWIRSNIDITARKRMEEALRQESEVVETLNRIGARFVAELDLGRLVQLLTDEGTRLTGARFGAFFYRALDQTHDTGCALMASAGALPEAWQGLEPTRCFTSPPVEKVYRVDDLWAEPQRQAEIPFACALPRVPSLRSLLSAPVLSRTQNVLGGLIFGHIEPGIFTDKHEQLLTGLVAQAAIAIQNARLYEQARKAEDRAARAAKLGEEFMGILGHDLRTPLQAISLSAGVLLGRTNLDPVQLRTVQRIAKNAERMGRLISDLLDFTRARLGTGLPIQLRTTNLHELCRRAAEEFEAAHPHRRLRLQLRGDCTGEWDPDRLAQVIANLLDNAVKYSPEDSAIKVRCSGDETTVQLEVHNEGPAIPPALIDTLFEPFRRAAKDDEAARSSLGLGLYIVRAILRAHGGEIEVRSNEAEGTTFTARLPRHRG